MDWQSAIGWALSEPYEGRNEAVKLAIRENLRAPALQGEEIADHQAASAPGKAKFQIALAGMARITYGSGAFPILGTVNIITGEPRTS